MLCLTPKNNGVILIVHFPGAASMCLGIPMKIVSVDGYNAYCEAKGVGRDVSLFMMQDDVLVPGDFVMVHVGYAIQKMSEQEARSAWELYDEMLALEDAELVTGAGDA